MLYHLSDLKSACITWDKNTETWTRTTKHIAPLTSGADYVMGLDVVELFDRMEKAARTIGMRSDIDEFSVVLTPPN